MRLNYQQVIIKMLMYCFANFYFSVIFPIFSEKMTLK
jgi:hypothetical protein